MAADGLDTGSGGVTEPAWRAFVERVAQSLDIGPGTSVFEVGCRSGSFLYPLAENDYLVGGLGASSAEIHAATSAMPSGRWMVGEACALDPGEPWDVVVAYGAFARFPDLDYARGILARMAAKAAHAVAILDVPDMETRDEALALRRGPPDPATRLFYDRRWMLHALAEIGASAVQVEDQRIEGSANARFCFNVFAML